jgi:N-acetylglucosaminyldiphosphoundecaprenol N-acetyl-beta-D-mannosaminyltransferase
MGCPRLTKTRKWIFEHKEKLKVPVAIGVGAAFKFLSGKIKRPPEWIGDLGFEWLWRFFQEPKRTWRRILDIPFFIFLIIFESIKKGLIKKINP